MYSTLLIAHSWLRWVVLGAALVALARSVGGWNRKGPWTRADDRASVIFTGALDLQILLGLLLYFVFSPMMETIRQKAGEAMGEAMGNEAMRYWLVEHPFGVVIAVVLAHIGRVRIKKTADAARKHRLAAIFFGLALVALAASLPWPGMTTGRPLLRW